MTNPDALRTVIERLEKLSGPDRIADAMIVVALDIRPDWLLGQRGELWVDDKADVGPLVRFNALGKRSTGNPPIGDFPRYTESIDAAMMLVPEGFAWSVRKHCDCRGPDADAFAKVSKIEWNDLENFRSGQARNVSPAIALSIAALKARSRQENENGE